MAHSCSCHASSAAETRSVEIIKRPAPARADETVETVSHRSPAALAVLKQLGINHCCGAHLTMAEAAAAAGVPLDRLLTAVNDAVGAEV